MPDARGDGVDIEHGSGGSPQASSCVVACPPTKAPEIQREPDTPPADEEQEQCWLEQERQEWARLRACSDRHLVDGEQLSQACSAAKESAEERLAIRWDSLPTPHLFKLADVPCTLLARASGADVAALMERNLKRRRAILQRNHKHRGGGGGGGITPAPQQGGSEEEAVKVINALLDWCRGELFPFLAEVDVRMAEADLVARATFLYRAVLHPLCEIARLNTG
jgi:hypothetical protein